MSSDQANLQTSHIRRQHHPIALSRQPDDIYDRDRYMDAMAETPETQLIEALKKVDVYGDIAPPHVQDPMTMVLRQNAIPADLIRWDNSRARFVLTGTGRNRITARSRTSGKILRFKMRDDKEGRAPLRKA